MNDITTKPDTTTNYLVASDFDQTLSFNDSGYALAEMLGMSDFEVKVTGLSRSNLVQPGAELTYLLRHDPAFAASAASTSLKQASASGSKTMSSCSPKS